MRKYSVTLSVLCGAVLAWTPASAGECDLRVATAQQEASCTIGTGVFFTDEQHSSGTGFIDSFVRLQQDGGTTWEQGYNTSARPLQTSVQVKVDPQHTRDLMVSELTAKTLTAGGPTYYEFFLDIGEPAGAGNKSYITLDQLEIYVSNTASLNYYQGTPQDGSSGTSGGALCTYKANGPTAPCQNGTQAQKIYDLDTGGDNYIQLDYLVKGSGNGSSDMVFYLPTSLFAGKTYIYLFSQFGDKYGVDYKYAAQGSFEEWFAHAKSGGGGTGPLNPIPEPSSLLLLGSGLGLAVRRWRQSRMA